MSQSIAGPAASTSPSDVAPLWRHPAFLGPLVAATAVGLSLPLWWPAAALLLTELEFAVARLLPQTAIAGAAWFALPAVGFGAGLLASFSPCILPLVPLNVAAIGAADVTGLRAAGASALFVAGASVALAGLGLFGDIAGFLLIEQRGPVLIVAGSAMLYLGLAAVGLAPLPFAGRAPGAGRRLGPFAAGAASMGAFALGYTALVFAAGAFGGSLVRSLRDRSFDAPRAAAAALLVVLGAGFAASGVAWF